MTVWQKPGSMLSHAFAAVRRLLPVKRPAAADSQAGPRPSQVPAGTRHDIKELARTLNDMADNLEALADRLNQAAAAGDLARRAARDKRQDRYADRVP